MLISPDNILPLISFLAGVVSIISPCILPIIPILFGFTLKQRKNIELVAFTTGLFLIFTVIIFITSFFTVIFRSYIYYIRLIAAIILAIIGLLFIFNKSFNVTIKSPNNNSGVFNSFILGILTSVAWAPCYSGYLISLLSILMTQGNVIYNSFNIILYSIGFGLAILILNLILTKIDFERFIKNSIYLRQIIGILFVIGSIYMILTASGIVIL